MARYTVVRLAEGLVVLLLISVVTFLIMRLLPGDPVMILLGEGGGGIRDDRGPDRCHSPQVGLG